MANTLGYITGALSGLALLCGINYSLDNPQRAIIPVNDTKSTIVRTLESIEPGNIIQVLADASHDIGQRNPERALKQLPRINSGLANTPYHDRNLRSAHYKNSKDLLDFIDEERDDQIAISKYLPSGFKTKQELVLAGAGLGLGLLTILAYANRRP